MITQHLQSYLISKKIPFVSLPFGVQIERKFYDYEIFKKFTITQLDRTFIINYPA